MTELNIVPKGALLIHNGIVMDVGPASRVENLAGARHAREIDATGRVVMPAFVDADVALVAPVAAGENRGDAGAFRLMSRKRVLARATAISAECARYGCLTIGAQTRCATDLRNVGKLLRVHQALQLKPARIRSIFSPQFPPDGANGATGVKTPAQMLETLTSKWLPTVKSKKLASVVELTVAGIEPGPDISGFDISGFDISGFDISMLRAAAVVAAGLGYAIRLRSPCRLEPVHLQLALSAGAIGIVAPMDTLRAFVGPLSAVGCIRVIPASEGFDDAENAAAAIRGAIGEGAAIALTSSYRPRGASSLNMQYLLYLAVHKLGLTPEEAIVATTWNPACSLRLSHVTGSLEPGKRADLLVMEVPDYRELARRAGHLDVSLAMCEGRIVARSPSLSVD
jgi:imidazolonepropionase